jgi:hypothetical protein
MRGFFAALRMTIRKFLGEKQFGQVLRGKNSGSGELFFACSWSDQWCAIRCIIFERGLWGRAGIT